MTKETKNDLEDVLEDDKEHEPAALLKIIESYSDEMV